MGKARDQLLAELRLLGAKGLVVSTNVELRLDGLPYSESRHIADPGVAVYFTSTVSSWSWRAISS